ncbi:MAG: SDR family oxidoreductase [Xanthobacteraceae bacterium]|jgi:NAD(P)-dependent dehydrogenase (short-subunit alcohol dehydrogenase family)
MSPMQEKVCVVTGATSGVGLQTATELALRGARVVLVGRETARGVEAMDLIRRRAPKADVAIHYADLARLDQVRELGAALNAGLPRIDVLINNAGAMFQRRQLTAYGLEKTFALNHMAYFLLSDLLRDRLIASAPSRIVNVASDAHRGVTLDFDDLQGEKRYSGFRAYQRSKLCNILFTRELARRLDGTGVTVNCLHPGFVATRFGEENGGLFRVAINLAKRVAAITPERGALTSLYLATSSQVAGETGGYYEKSKLATPSAAAQDDDTARRLWEVSARIAGTAPQPG